MERDGTVTVIALCRKKGGSRPYIEQIITLLRKVGMVMSTRAPGRCHLPSGRAISLVDTLLATQRIPEDALFSPAIHALAGISFKMLIRVGE